MSAACVADCRDTLGEGCIFDPRDRALYWTDIEGRRIHRLSIDGTLSTFPLLDRAAFVLPRRDPGFVVGFEDRIALADPNFRQFTTLHVIEPDLPQTRVNDAAVDPTGGIVFGTFDERDRQPVASLYRLAPSGMLSQLFGGVTISNGIAFSPDGLTMYFADTAIGTIRRFAVGADFETFDEIAPLAGPAVAPGRPDGAIVDSQGCYWSARVWGSCLVRIDPNGRVVERVELPVIGPTCVALGGARMTRLFATTLRIRHTPEELLATPEAGGLFAADVAIPGATPRLCIL